MHSHILPTDPSSPATATYQPAANADVEPDPHPRPILSSRLSTSAGRHQGFTPVITTSTGDSQDQLRRNRWAKSTLAKWFVRWGPNLAMLFVIMIGIASATGLYLWFHSVEEQNFSRDFESLSRISVRSLEAVMSVRCFQHLRNLAAFGYAVPELTRDTLVTFAKHSSFDAKVVYNLAFFVIVPRVQQPDFERHYNVSVWNSPGSDQLVKNDSFMVMPVLIHPYEERATNRFFGYNALSDPSRRTPILTVIESNSWGISQPIRFKDTGEPGFITWHTVSEREPTALTPFTKYLASVSIAFTDLFSTTLNQRLKSPQASDVAVYISFESGERVYEYVPPQNTSATRLNTRRTLHLTFDGFSAKWRVDFVPTRRYVKRFQTPVPWVVLGSALAVFVLLSYAARRGMARFIVSQQVMKKLRVQDTLLESLQEYSKAIIQAIPDGVVMLDEQGWIIGINDAALKMTGYELSDFAQPKKIDVLLAGSGSGAERRQREMWDKGEDDSEGGSDADENEDDETDPLLSPRHVSDSSSPSRSGNQAPANSISSSPVHARFGTAATTTTTKNRLEPGNQQTRMRRKDGSVFIAQVTISNVDNPPSDGEQAPDTATAAEAAAPDSESEPVDSSFSPTIDRRPSELTQAIPPQLRDAHTSNNGIMHRLEVALPMPLLRRLSSTNRVGVVSRNSLPQLASDMQAETQRDQDDYCPAPPAPTPCRSPSPAPAEPEPEPEPATRSSSRQLAQVYMFYDCTEKVETLRAVAEMERQASEAAKAKHQLLEFLVHCMLDPLRHMKEDIKAIHAQVVEARASDSIGNGNDEVEAVNEEEMNEARMAAEHIVRVLEDIAGFADITLASDQVPAGVVTEDAPSPSNTAASNVRAGRPGAGPPPGPGTLGHFVTSCILAQDMMDSLASRHIQFTANANPPHANILVPGILIDTITRTKVAQIVRRLLALGETCAQPDGLMTMAVELQHLRQVAATGAYQIVAMMTVSHFDPALPQSTSLDMAQLGVSANGGEGEGDLMTRGTKFANIGLTWAAVLKMVERMGGKVEQTRVSMQAGLVVVVTLPLPVAL
ncbi:hypothetical protein BCR44DRAFT_1429871 [Catenaria anguillulae PL171]|uniref:PAS domain-containing protein n=1 Tax=Catenaria anguillulae PL171 TaxID=765915 RepID=A0A1Y2HVM2_9FUNG|nr:hypothetical protein BCR44DRAFT_1429871 [Catenaria anguillulae PL171]